jgi:hypothetical protein
MLEVEVVLFCDELVPVTLFGFGLLADGGGGGVIVLFCVGVVLFCDELGTLPVTLFGFGLLADGGGGGVIVLFCVRPVRGFELFKGVLVVIFPGRLGVPFVIAGEPIFRLL